MNIVVACDGLFSGKGGMERLAIELAEYLARLYSVHVVYTGTSVDTAYKLNDSVQKTLIDLDSIEDAVEKLNFVGVDVYIYFATNQRLLKHAYIASSLKAKMIVTESASPMRINYTNWKHSKWTNFIGSPVERYGVLSQVSAIRVEVEESVNYFPAFLQEKVHYFPNGTEEIRITQKNTPQKHRILFVGLSKNHKRFDIALKALNEVINVYQQDIDLVVAGVYNKDTKYMKEYLQYIEENNLNEHIEFLGAQDDMTPIYRSCSIHLICSGDESFGLVTIESMCAGLPTIGCRNSIGTRNLVKDGQNGLLYDDVEDFKSLGKLLSELSTNKTLYKQLSQNALIEAKKYNKNLYYNNWEKLIQSVITQDKNEDDSTLEYFLKHKFHLLLNSSSN